MGTMNSVTSPASTRRRNWLRLGDGLLPEEAPDGKKFPSRDHDQGVQRVPMCQPQRRSPGRDVGGPMTRRSGRHAPGILRTGGQVVGSCDAGWYGVENGPRSSLTTSPVVIAGTKMTENAAIEIGEARADDPAGPSPYRAASATSATRPTPTARGTTHGLIPAPEGMSATA